MMKGNKDPAVEMAIAILPVILYELQTKAYLVSARIACRYMKDPELA